MNRKTDLRALLVLLLAMLLGLLMPPARQAAAMTPEDILTMRTIAVADLDATGKRLLYTIGAWNPEHERRENSLYLRDLDSGRDLLLLGSEDGAWGAVWRPDGGAVTYLKQGSAGTELWSMTPDGGNRHRLSAEAANFGELHWAPDGSAVAWTASAPVGDYDGEPGRFIVADDLGYRHLGTGYREGRLHQLFVLDLAAGQVTRVVQDSLDVRSVDWSPDSRDLVFAAKAQADLNRNLNTDLWVVSRAGKGLRRITANPGKDADPRWLPEGGIAYLRSMDPLSESGPQAVAVIDPDAGDAGPMQLNGTGFGNWVSRFTASEGRFFVLGARRGHLDLVEVKGDRSTVLTDGEHDFWSVRVAGPRVIMTGAGQTLPGAIFTVDLAEKSKGPHHARILIDPNLAWRQRVDLVDPEHFTVQVDGRAIEGWFYKPPDLTEDQSVPTVLSIHGGPEWMYGGYFLPEFHILPSYGYAVVIANPTGSMGYGFDFQQGVRGDWVERPGRELLACVDLAVAQGWADPGALAVMGGSYGGHLAADLTTQTDRFKAAAVDRMFPDLISFWGTTDEKWFPEWEFKGRPWEPQAREIYLRNSPLTRVDKVVTPTLISQGMEDYRCLIAGGEMWFSSLRAQGVPSRFIRFEHEGHGIGDPRDQVFYQRQLLDFFDRHVLDLHLDEGEAPEDSLAPGGSPLNR